MANRVTRNHRRDGIQFGANGYLSLADNEIDVSSGDLTLDVEGDIKLDANGNSIYFADGAQTAGFVAMTSGAATRLRLYEMGGDSDTDYLNIDVKEHGETDIKTSDVAGTAAHILIQPDGDLTLDPASQKIIINATDKLYLDGGTDTYIYEDADDDLRIVVGNVGIMTLYQTAAVGENYVSITNSNLRIPSTHKLHFDGGGDTFIQEVSADNLKFVVGDDTVLELTEAGNSGNLVNMGTSGAGFTQHEPTYDAADTQVYFAKLGNKAFLTFGAGDIGNMLIYFPNASCNCTLVIKQDGTGSRTVTSWKAHDQAAGNATNVQWAGGSAPTLSTGANAIDIISFYWDNDNHTAYGVASLNFS
mgnify:CR=1 FL=1